MKKIFTYTMLFALALSATARERSYEEKCRIASSILGTQTANKAKAADGTKSSATLTTLDQATGYTVIGYEQGGFAIVSNDDARTPVIGYSTTDKFDATQPALAWYLDNANAAMQAGTTRAVSAASIPEGCKASVDALLGGIIWNQMGNPYVDLCPIVLSKDVNCVVGCEAVAMAQIMAYHKYPTKGIGTGSVTYNGMPYTVYFSEATYDWANMLDEYKSGGTYTAAQRMAIGRLMYHCGVASGMAYGQSGSGTYTKDAASGMAKYFGYKVKRYGYKGQDNYKDANEWYSVIYKELSLGNPILYSGSSTKTSVTNPYIHAFVLDGYDADGNVHVNWGYSGQGNGFFDPTVLNMTINGQTEEFTGYNDMAIIRTPDSEDIHYFEGSPVGINSATVDETDANAPKYSVDGMRVDDSYKGVYIQNGKKYIAK